MIDKIPYLKSLKINAVDLTPVMESGKEIIFGGIIHHFNFALDKAYGTSDKFKEFRTNVTKMELW